METHFTFPSASLETIPGLTSISSPIWQVMSKSKFLLPYLENSFYNTSTSNATSQLFDRCTRFIHIKRTNDNETRGSSKISERNWNLWANVFTDHVNIVSKLCYTKIINQQRFVRYLVLPEIGIIGADSATVPFFLEKKNKQFNPALLHLTTHP